MLGPRKLISNTRAKQYVNRCYYGGLTAYLYVRVQFPYTLIHVYVYAYTPLEKRCDFATPVRCLGKRKGMYVNYLFFLRATSMLQGRLTAVLAT